jgi:hypothetical protein
MKGSPVRVRRRLLIGSRKAPRRGLSCQRVEDRRGRLRSLSDATAGSARVRLTVLGWEAPLHRRRGSRACRSGGAAQACSGLCSRRGPGRGARRPTVGGQCGGARSFGPPRSEGGCAIRVRSGIPHDHTGEAGARQSRASDRAPTRARRGGAAPLRSAADPPRPGLLRPSVAARAPARFLVRSRRSWLRPSREACRDTSRARRLAA